MERAVFRYVADALTSMGTGVVEGGKAAEDVVTTLKLKSVIGSPCDFTCISSS